MSWPCWSLEIHLYPVMSTLPQWLPQWLEIIFQVFILTRGDGTPFNASSFLEEDVVKICIQLGHTHPEGVLQYSTTKSVMLFHTADKLQIMACGVVKASTLHDEAIRVRTSPPSATHMRAYMAVVGGEPSGTQPPPSDGEEEPNLSPSNYHPGGRTP